MITILYYLVAFTLGTASLANAEFESQALTDNFIGIDRAYTKTIGTILRNSGIAATLPTAHDEDYGLYAQLNCSFKDDESLDGFKMIAAKPCRLYDPKAAPGTKEPVKVEDALYSYFLLDWLIAVDDKPEVDIVNFEFQGGYASYGALLVCLYDKESQVAYNCALEKDEN